VLYANLDLANTATPYNNGTVMSVQGAATAKYIYLTVTSSGALNLYVDSLYQATGAVIPWASARQHIELRFDMSSATWKASVYVNGSLYLSEETDSSSAETSTICKIHGFSIADRATRLSQYILGNAYADSFGANPWVISRNLTTDVSESETYVQSTGSVNATVLARPVNTGTYIDSPDPPSAGSNFVCNAGTLDSLAGFTVASVQSVRATFCTSGQNTVRAKLGDGSAEVTGTSKTISDGNVHMVQAGSVNKPSGGAWGGSDTPTAEFEIVS
jgi:hypothetical protein